MSVSDCIKKYFCCLIASNPRRNITYAWFIALLLVLISFIVACIASARMAKTGSAGVAASFCAMWTAILLIIISIVGSVIMRKYKSTMAIGLFIGVIFIMSQQMLILFTVFVERSQVQAGQVTIYVTQSQQAMAVFSWFLFMVYGAFGIMLFVFRNDLIADQVPMDQSVEEGKPYNDSRNATVTQVDYK